MGGVKVGGSIFYLQSALPHPPLPSSPQTLPSLFSSISSSSSSSIKTNKRKGSDCFCDLYYNISNNHIISHQSDHLSTFLGATSRKLSRRRSLDDDFSAGPRRRRGSKEQALRRRALTACLYYEADGSGKDDEFLRRLPESAFEDDGPATDISPDSRDHQQEAETTIAEPPWSAIRPEPPNCPDSVGIVPGAVEMKANSVDLPVSLRTIKREEEVRRGSAESPCSSVNKAFSSMVFIIRELHSYTLQMREILFSENLQEILTRVQTEMNASFVWLFQQIFSCTPTLMVYLMLLLANFTVYSIAPNHNAMAAAGSPNPPAHATATVNQAAGEEVQHQNWRYDDSSSIKSFLIGRTASVGGSGRGGGKAKPVAGATNDGGRSDGSSSCVRHTIFADGMSTASSGGELIAEAAVMEEEELVVWNGIVEEASRMKASSRAESLMDPGTLRRLVSPVTVELEPEEYSEYLQTELMYHKALSQDPDNVVLLSNFAQFLFIVLHDHDRAECYHKRAIVVRPADAEALNRYASFLWLARKDLEAAEETYLEAIAADPGNPHYAASYAHFLWSTGGDDTCYPIDDGGDADASSCESI